MDTTPAWLRPLLIGLIGVAVVMLVGGGIWWISHRVSGTSRTEGAVQHVSLTTTDGVVIMGSLYQPTGTPKGAVLMLHMMPATRVSWNSFATALAGRGYLGLAIDLRGHGESTQRDGTTLNYQTFSDGQHQDSRRDVAAALGYLMNQQKIPAHAIGIVGASIGANLALEALAGNHELLWAVLLSPGLDYHGILTEPTIRQMAPPQRLLLVASDDDVYSLQTIERLSQVAPTMTTTQKLAGAGHGTTMFDRTSDLGNQVLNWIETNNLKLSSPQ